MKVLIIEDNPEIVEVICFAFELDWPEAIVTATHLGEEGLELLQTESPDAVILDLGLPDISGFEVLKRIRHLSQIPVIILSAMSDEDYVVKALEYGADEYITKPFRPLELLTRVKILSSREMVPIRGAK